MTSDLEQALQNDNVTALVEYMTPVRREFVIAAEALFNRLQYTDHELDVANATASSYEFESVDNADFVVKLYYDHCVKLLLAAGVRPELGIEIIHLQPLVEGVFDLERDHNRDIVLDILEEDLEPEQTLARLLGEITEDSETRWYPRLENVDESLIARLKMLTANEDMMFEYDETAAQIKAVYARFKELNETTIVASIATSFQQLPISPEPVLRMYSDEMSTMVTTDTAKELVAIAIVSGALTKEDIVERVNDYFNRFFEPSYAIMALPEVDKIAEGIF